MLSIRPDQRVWVACYAVDFRKGIDALMAESYQIGVDPFGGDMVIFISKDKHRAKILYCNSFYAQITYRRLHKGGYKIPFFNEKSCRQMDMAEMHLFLEGHHYIIQNRTKPWEKIDDS